MASVMVTLAPNNDLREQGVNLSYGSAFDRIRAHLVEPSPLPNRIERDSTDSVIRLKPTHPNRLA